MRRSWVATTSVEPDAAASSSSKSMARSQVASSRAEVGSSASSSGGRFATARAIATRWASPTERSRARRRDQRRDAEAREALVDPAVVLRQVREVAREAHVVARVEDADEVQGLRDESHVARAEGVAARAGQRGHILAGDAHAAGGRA